MSRIKQGSRRIGSEHARAEPPVRPLLLTIRDAARVLSVGRTTMYELIAAGAIEVVHIGRSARVPVAALEAFVQQQRRGTVSVSSSGSSPAAVGRRKTPRRRVPSAATRRGSSVAHVHKRETTHGARVRRPLPRHRRQRALQDLPHPPRRRSVRGHRRERQAARHLGRPQGRERHARGLCDGVARHTARPQAANPRDVRNTAPTPRVTRSWVASSCLALTPSAIREWHHDLVAPGGVSANTAAKCYRLLRTILSTAVADELLARNPCRISRAAVERASERPTATVAQVRELADAMPTHLRAMVLLAGFCGLRLGELLGLEQRHINLLHGLLTVEQQEHQLRNGELLLGPPKSDAGRRTIALRRSSCPSSRHTSPRTRCPGRTAASFPASEAARCVGTSSRSTGLKPVRPSRSRPASASTTCAIPRTPSRPRPAPARGPHAPHGTRIAASRASLPTRHARARHRDRQVARRPCRGRDRREHAGWTRDGSALTTTPTRISGPERPADLHVCTAGAGDENRTRVLSLGS